MQCVCGGPCTVRSKMSKFEARSCPFMGVAELGPCTGTLPIVDRQTDMAENLTFLQLLWLAVKP